MVPMQAPSAGQSSLESLPEGLIFDIFCLLTPSEVASKVLPLSRLLRSQAENPLLWQHFCGGADSGLTEGDAANKGGWKKLFHKVYCTNLICCPHFELIDYWEKRRQVDDLQAFEPVRLSEQSTDVYMSTWHIHKRKKLDNPDGNEGADPLMLDQHSGYTPWLFQYEVNVARELTPVGCPPCPAAIGKPVLVTGHIGGTAVQSIGLENFPLAFCKSCPAILVSAWYAGRSDCPSNFKMEMGLLRGGREIHSWTASHDRGPPIGVVKRLPCPRGAWAKFEKLITGYEGDVDEIRLVLGGRDARCWAGWYGAKFTAISVRFVPPGEVAKYGDLG